MMTQNVLVMIFIKTMHVLSSHLLVDMTYSVQDWCGITLVGATLVRENQ